MDDRDPADPVCVCNTVLTVTGGDGIAWQVTVDRNGEQGWLKAGCAGFPA